MLSGITLSGADAGNYRIEQLTASILQEPVTPQTVTPQTVTPVAFNRTADAQKMVTFVDKKWSSTDVSRLVNCANGRLLLVSRWKEGHPEYGCKPYTEKILVHPSKGAINLGQD
jgi:hypothetical protein